MKLSELAARAVDSLLVQVPGANQKKANDLFVLAAVVCETEGLSTEAAREFVVARAKELNS